MLTTALALAFQTTTLPNIVVILADDLGYADNSVTISKKIPTPNFNSVATSGLVFSNAYSVAPCCAPSRAGLMTGYYPQRFGFEFNPPEDAGNYGLPLDQRTLAERLKPLGYQTGLIGKWHLGFNPEFHPINRGFDYSYCFYKGQSGYYPEDCDNLFENDIPVGPTKFLTEDFTDHAVSYIQNHAGGPFFLTVAYNAVHVPLECPQIYKDRFPDLSGDRQTMAGMVSALDDGIGQINNALIATHVSGNTIFIIANDNGGWIHIRQTINPSDNSPLLGEKFKVQEGGIRIPMVMRWRGYRTGAFDGIVSLLDVVPTVMALAHAPVTGLDGVNLTAWLKKTDFKIGNPHPTLYWRMGTEQAVRDGNWKYSKRTLNTGVVQERLYDLSTDIGETTNLATSHVPKVTTLKTKWQTWSDQMSDPKW
jgi:arylsulfatase A-like enzyme